ncbi:ATP-dependent DNA helicase PIF1-like protein [Tanacetum coccineum]
MTGITNLTILHIGVDVSYHTLGPPSYECSNCHATTWYEERSNKARKVVNPSFLLCCQNGKVRLPKYKPTPQPLHNFLNYNDPGMGRFRDHIRVYNSMFSFTSFSARIDHSNNTENEVRNRMGAFIDNENGEGVHKTKVQSLLQMLDQYSALAKAFRMARDWCRPHTCVNVELNLLSDRTNARQYNGPTVSEVASLITNDFGDGIPTRDIIVNKQDSGPKRISELLPSYMALQYPLLFPYGEDGFHDSIPYYSNSGARKTNCGFVTIKEYYSYTIHHRKDQGHLACGLYHNVCDAVTRGDTNAAGLGKRIVLPGTFTGGPRYMMQNYLDAMAICRPYGNPYLFITFTSNLKWQEISEMLAYVRGQKPHDRPEVGTRVFKLKSTELLDDLQKNKSLVHVVEKRGLPHAHILLWLEEDCKCKTAAQIDDIISAELPSLTNDPDGYKVVTEYMLHGPCGNEGRYDPCTTEGKCTKRYPKAFYAETILDDDGYPIYHHRDNKVYLAPCEAVWRMFSFDIHYSYPAMMKLNFHLPEQNPVTLHDSENLPALLQRKEACFAYGLLNDDKEWTCAISEASGWALGPQLRDLFVTILLFYDVGRPLKLWEETWELSSKDILFKKQKLFKYPDLQLTTGQMQNYCLVEIQELLNRSGREALDFDINKSKIEHQQLHPLLNPEHRLIYEQVIDSVHNQRGAFYFVYGPGGTGKTFLYRPIVSRLRSKQKIVLAVTSSGIASLLLPGGRTACSRFVIPLELLKNITCGIKQNTHLAELMQEVQLIIWDEAPMTQKYAFEALDKTLRDILGFHKEEKRDKIFEGITVLLGGDFRQILPVIPKGKRSDVIQACINGSYLWKHCKVFRLTRSMRVNEYNANGEIDTRKRDFNQWVLAVGDGTLLAKAKDGEDEPTWIEIPEEFLIKSADSPI